MVKKEDLSGVSYVLGIISIVMAFFTPLAGLIFGIIGFKLSKKQKTKKINTWGIVLSSILFILQIIITIYVTMQGLNSIIPGI